MTKALAAFAAACLLALAAVGLIAKHQATKLGELSAQNEQLQRDVQTAAKAREADTRALALLRQKNAATAREAAAARASLADALAKEREWAEQPVPEAVREVLK